jgi:hypothetical protein
MSSHSTAAPIPPTTSPTAMLRCRSKRDRPAGFRRTGVVDGMAALESAMTMELVGGANHRDLGPVDRRGRRVALDDLRARSRLCGDAEDRDGGLTTYWTTPSGSTSLLAERNP